MQAELILNMPQIPERHNGHSDAFTDLKRRTKITRMTRFQASLRLERRQKISYFVISFLSLLVILISLLPNIYDLSDASKQIFLALTIVNSVFVIITTFLEASGNFVHKGEQLHRSARKVSTVYNKLLLLEEEERVEKERIRKLQKAYQLALDECPFNHDNLDYARVRIQEPHLFSGKACNKRNIGFALMSGRFICWFREYLWLIPHTIVIITSLAIVAYILCSSSLENGPS